MEPLSKDQMREKAKACFAANKHHSEYHQTSDGSCFTNWHDANEHSKVIGIREIVLQKRSEDRPAVDEEKLEQIQAAASIDELMKIKIGNREHPSVRDAMEARIKEFQQAELKTKSQDKGQK